MAGKLLSDLDQRLRDNETIFFDGVCVLCGGLVDFVIKRDRAHRYRFATLQSELGQELLRSLELPANRLETFVLVEKGVGYTKSTAALRITRMLRWPWPVLYILILIPKPLRDSIYGWVGRHRYPWFGKLSVCRIPTAEDRDLFLE